MTSRTVSMPVCTSHHTQIRRRTLGVAAGGIAAVCVLGIGGVLGLAVIQLAGVLGLVAVAATAPHRTGLRVFIDEQGQPRVSGAGPDFRRFVRRQESVGVSAQLGQDAQCSLAQPVEDGLLADWFSPA